MPRNYHSAFHDYFGNDELFSMINLQRGVLQLRLILSQRYWSN